MSVAAEMDAALVKLRTALDNTRRKIDGTWFFPFVGSDDTAKLVVQVTERTLELLAGEFRARVLSSSMPYAEWQAIYRERMEKLRQYNTDVDTTFSFSAVVGAAAKDAAADAGAFALTAAGISAGALAIWGLAAVAVYALVSDS